MFKQIDVNYVLYTYRYENNAYTYKRYDKFNTEDTYICIFNTNQHQYLNLLKTDPEIKIIFISDAAINTNHPAYGPRNRVVVFEWLGNATNHAQSVNRTEKTPAETIW